MSRASGLWHGSGLMWANKPAPPSLPLSPPPDYDNLSSMHTTHALGTHDPLRPPPSLYLVPIQALYVPKVDGVQAGRVFQPERRLVVRRHHRQLVLDRAQHLGTQEEEEKGHRAQGLWGRNMHGLEQACPPPATGYALREDGWGSGRVGWASDRGQSGGIPPAPLPSPHTCLQRLNSYPYPSNTLGDTQPLNPATSAPGGPCEPGPLIQPLTRMADRFCSMQISNS